MWDGRRREKSPVQKQREREETGYWEELKGKWLEMGALLEGWLPLKIDKSRKTL